MTPPTLDGAYDGSPPDVDFWKQTDSAVALMDLVAYVTGTVVVRNLDGTYILQNATDADVGPTDSRPSATSAGGELFSNDDSLRAGDLSASQNCFDLASMTVLFPKYVGTATTPSGVYSIPITLNPDGLGDQTVFVPSKALLSEADGTPSNSGALAAYAAQLAADYVAYLGDTALDESYPGIVDWTPDGLHYVIWSYSARKRQCFTRVVRSRIIPRLVTLQVQGSITDNSLCTFASLQTTDCLTAKGPNTSVILTYNSDTGHWISTDLLTYSGGSGIVNFWWDGRLHLAVGVDSYDAPRELMPCDGMCWKGGVITGHLTNGTSVCDGPTFTVCLACSPCTAITTPCCPGVVMSDRLCLKVTNATGLYAYAIGISFELHYSEVNNVCYAGFPGPQWFGSGGISPFGITVWYYCSTTGTFGLAFYSNGIDHLCPVPTIGVAFSCNPFGGTYIIEDGSVGTITVSITNGVCTDNIIPTTCCPSNLLPNTLTATLTGAGSCNGSYTLTNTGAQDWSYDGPLGGCPAAAGNLLLSCSEPNPGLGFAWHLYITGTQAVFAANNCATPSWGYSIPMGAACGCTAGGAITITV